MLVVAPPQQIRDAFTQIIRPMFLKKAGTISESVILAAIRDALLPKLISGEVRVPGTEGGDNGQ
jgi:type I restriction enzyme S subunit